MSNTISVEEAQCQLKELIHKLAPGDGLIITENQLPVAKLTTFSEKPLRPRQPGKCQGMITLLIEDDEHLDGFAEYMT